MITLQGFPTKISDEIELPDMAELLMYPYFFDTELEDAYKYSTPFQRKLIDMCSIDSSKKHYSLLSQVRVLLPKYRSCTGGGGDYQIHDSEWHIDNEENEDGPYIFHEEKDIVTLLTNKTSAMTQFNKNKIEINLEPEIFNGFNEFSGFLQKNFQNGNPLKIEAQDMPANKLVTFTNHLHRATDPSQIEFRYMFRLVQTNRERPPVKYNPHHNISNILNQSQPFLNIDRSESSVKIFLPSGFKDGFKKYEEDKKESINAMNGQTFNEYDFYFGNQDNSNIEQFNITNVEFGTDFLSQDSELIPFSLENPIFLYSVEDFNEPNKNKKLLDFLSLSDKSLEIISPEGKVINAILQQNFFSMDKKLGPIVGAIGYTTKGEQIVPGVEYSLRTNSDIKYRFTIDPTIKLIRK